MTRPTPPADARTRLVEAADRLFYDHGIRAVGVDRVVAEAGVAKATLYAHFPAKDDLILAVLAHREAALTGLFAAGMARHAAHTPDPLGAFFATLKDWFGSSGFRGCAFQNAVAELADPAHPGAAFARGQKQRFHAFLAGLVPAPAAGAAAVALLVEGAIQMAVLHGSPAAADTARDAARRLIRGMR